MNPPAACRTPSRRAPWRRAAAALAVGVLAAAAALPSRAQAADEPAGPGIAWSASAFGTVGWAQSNRSFTFQRFIKDKGGFERDTVFGAQLDAQFSPRWSATLQARLAPSVSADARWKLEPSWAFVAWRPADEWLLRVGKLRVPLYLRSEQLDVGQTYDEARLPAELYSLAPANDFAGMHLNRSLSLRGGELSVDGYWGHAELYKRFWLRDGLPPQLPAGPAFTKIDTTVAGLVGTWRSPDLTVRVGVHRASIYPANGSSMLVRPSLVPLGPGLSYWQTSNQLPGPGVETAARFHNVMLLVGAEANLGQGWRVAGEVSRIMQHDIEMGIDSLGGYLALYRRIGRFTPYVSVAALRTMDMADDWSQRLDTTVLPTGVPGAEMLNASMKTFADFTPVYHQKSIALGGSFDLTPRSKLKLEWLRTRASQTSLIDVPAGEPLRRTRSVDVLSLGYSFVY